MSQQAREGETMGLARRLRDLLLCIFFFLFIGLIVVRMAETTEGKVEGEARVVDGDTLVVSDMRVRLIGMDAPELAQTCLRAAGPWRCGSVARDRLLEMVGAGDVQCRLRGEDRYGRSLGRCTVGPLDLGATMVREGQAVAFGDYEPEEEAARRQKRGLWSGTFDRPRIWRQTHGGMSEAPHISADWMTRLWSRIGHEGD
ncbi:hypothetical protein AX760_05565 [Pararhizobium antarcticum]|uniref:TNase-like domain-containing protein n=2 Tax=Pararhizobium antarcticum TaxID=1798805 RepID=A0A657LP28_9HYPH|nr:hypothetical protein AX760_05565 [Pararhizobium antarcticum]OJG00433.1 hypothetical protein AX761_08405 [Rhizobium sp. 58]